MASAKNSVVTALSRICVSASLLLPLSSLAATPVAVWDGDFTTLTKSGYTIDLQYNDLNQDSSAIEIARDIGVRVESSGTFQAGFTVLFRYSGLNLSLADKQALATAILTDKDDRTGVYIDTAGKSCGIWDGGSWNTSGTFNSMTSSQTSGVLAFSHYSTTTYSGSGTRLYYRGNKYRSDSPLATILDAGTLGSDGDKEKYKGFSIGGRSAPASDFSAALGMSITGVAVFNGVLSTSEIADYFFPSEVLEVPVSAGTPVSVSSINAQVAAGSYSVVFVNVADGGTISVDEAFSSAVQFVVTSKGSVTLSAASQPSASFFGSVDFSGVEGALLRSWLTPGVVGFNFDSTDGNDTSGALATGVWHDNASDKDGTSTAMFADGLSVLTWSSATCYRYSGSSLLNGYLDDGSNGGNGAVVKLTGVPYTTYDVIIYASSDSNPGTFLAKTVNGKTYTWDSATGAVAEGSSGWGKAALSIPVYGVNAMRIKNLTGPLTIYGGARDGSSSVRGGIAAIQIMPPNTPDNVHVYELTLDGTATTWTGGNWTIDGNTVDPPVAGLVKIVANASTALTLDSDVFLADLVVTGQVNAVVNVATNGTTGSLYSIKTTVAGGVLQQGSPSVLGTTPTLVVEDGATFDFNGFSVDAVTAIHIAGAGAGNWPWALTSSGWDSVGTVQNMYLEDDATIGGANKLLLGANWSGSYCYLQGHTLTKTGAGEMHVRNWNISDNGTIIVRGGELHTDQWNCLNKNTQGRVTLTIEANGSLRGTNQASNPPASTTLDWDGTLNTATRNFIVKETLNGGGSTATLNFESGVTANLTRNLTVTSTLTLSGSATFLKSGSAASDVAVSPVALSAASGTITVGPGVTFNLGTSRPSAVFAVNADATITVRRTSAADVPQFYVSSRPVNIVLYDETGNVVSDPTIVYDSEKGTLTLVSAGYIWTGASGTWTDSQFDGKPGDTTGFDVSFSQEAPAQSAVTVSVSGAKSVNSISFVAQDTEYTLTGDKITAVGGVDVNSQAAPVTIGNAVDGAITLNSGATLTLAGTAAVIQDSALSGAGTLVLDPGAGNTYTMSAANTSFTGEAVIKSGTVKMGDKTAFGPLARNSVVRVNQGATISTGCNNGGTEGETNHLVLEEGSTYTSYVSTSDTKFFPFSKLTLAGNANVVANVANVGVTKHYNDPTTHDFGEYTLTKTGRDTLYLSAMTINGSGMLDIEEGTLNLCNGFFVNYANTNKFLNGTVKIAQGATLTMEYYHGQPAALLTKNLVLDGNVIYNVAIGVLHVTGYVSGSGTTPMLTLADGAVLKPSGTGYLRITESLNLPNDTMTIDLSGIDFSTRSSVPLFKVGSAAMLPDSGHIKFVVGSNQVSIPEGWELKLTKNGLGYKLRKTAGFVIKL